MGDTKTGRLLELTQGQLNYAPSSPERGKLIAALKELRPRLPVRVPKIEDGNDVTTEASKADVETYMPSETSSVFAKFAPATETDISTAIEKALEAKRAWQDTPFVDRAAIFLRAAELVTKKYRYEISAATMLGQGKNAWQAEIDAAAELADFYRFNVSYAEEIYSRQPTLTAAGQAG